MEGLEMAMSQVTKYFPNLAKGWNPNLPPRVMDPDADPPTLYLDMLNYIARDGRLQRRPCLTTIDSTLVPPSTLTNEKPLWVQFVDTTNSSGADDYCTIVVTNQQIFVKPNTAAAWVNATPIYSTGTITATNGSSAIVGSGTAWSTNNVGKFSTLKIGIQEYTITAINSDTSITISGTFTGTTGAGKAYTIRRNFVSAVDLFCVVFNQNLYVAGTSCGGIGIAGFAPVPAVIKVSNIFSSPTTAYLTSGAILSPGLDFIGISRVSGIQALQDGRVVVAGSQNTIYYSSHLNDAVWTASPGGNTPIVLINGEINALGDMANNLTLHHNYGIVFGYPTGQADPPLRFQASGSHQGCYAPRSLKMMMGREYYVTISGDVCAFDGNMATVVGESIRPVLRPLDRVTLHSFFAGVDSDRGEYILMTQWSSGNHTFWHYQGSTGSWYPCQTGSSITAISDVSVTNLLPATTRHYIGLLAPTTSDPLTGQYIETTPGDTLAFTGGLTPGGVMFTTDDIDFGDPRSYKNIQRVIIWADHASGSTETFNFQISRDRGVTWSTASGFMVPTSAAEAFRQFCFDELDLGAGTAWRFRLLSQANNNTTVRPTRMLVIATTTGAIDYVET
jgi:hypothetical protein